ncbi:leucyl aminopeptidase [Candidatus Woesearchaeota archaeon]|nr:leucyl aminopeptidase [Candidatus Woesearchaeota archaeon]
MLSLKDFLNGVSVVSNKTERGNMKITITKDLDKAQEVLFLGLFEEDKDNGKSFSKELAEEVEAAIGRKAFSRKFGEIYSTKLSSHSYKKIAVMGLGEKKDLSVEKVRQVLGKMITSTKNWSFSSLCTNVVEKSRNDKFNPEMLGRAAAEGLLLANYNFTKYLAKEKQEKKKPLSVVSLQWSGSNAFSEGLTVGRIVAEATNMVRDLVNEPANLVNSDYMEKVAKQVAGQYNSVKLKVLNKAELEKEGMGSLLGVNAGSQNPPKLLILEYTGSKKGKHTAMIGKGITFDSGGYNLKPTKYIEDMKTDMAGAAAVMAAIKVAAELKVKKNLLGVMPLCENMVDATAQHPGDIVKAFNGKTIEIGNTDAEGRLILCDALAYTEAKYAPEVMIDLATLTGACVVALGYYAAGVVGTDAELLKKLEEAGTDSGDRVWPLPFFEEYQDWMDGTITDLNNCSQKGKGYEAGSITAGVFLGKFVEKAKWAHVDIAGSAYWCVDGPYLTKGATGSGVRLLSYYLLNNQEKE